MALSLPKGGEREWKDPETVFLCHADLESSLENAISFDLEEFRCAFCGDPSGQAPRKEEIGPARVQSAAAGKPDLVGKR
jgi:hypothetical protein